MKARIPANRVPYSPQGVEEFKSLEQTWKKGLEDIILGITQSTTKEGILIANIDLSPIVDEYNKLVEEARNKVEHGVLMTGLHAGLTGTQRQLIDAETLKSETEGGFNKR